MRLKKIEWTSRARMEYGGSVSAVSITEDIDSGVEIV